MKSEMFKNKKVKATNNKKMKEKGCRKLKENIKKMFKKI